MIFKTRIINTLKVFRINVMENFFGFITVITLFSIDRSIFKATFNKIQRDI